MRPDYMRAPRPPGRPARSRIDAARRTLAGAAVSAWLIAVGLYAMAVDLLHMPGGRRSGQVWAGVDFHTYLAAVVVAMKDGWASLYDQGLVTAAQEQMVPSQFSQPYLSPPVDALLVWPLAALPYRLALAAWVAVLLAALISAFAWTSPYRGGARIAAVAVAMAPWWVLLAVYVGQVVPLVAAALLVSWRLARERRDVAAGLVLSLIALKPNTAILVPFAMLAARPWRMFESWVGGSVALTAASVLAIGPDGAGDYLEWLRQLPRGGAALTLEGAFGATGALALAGRVAIIAAALVIARMLRSSPGIPIAAGAIGSLLVAPYLHNSDLCVLVVAGWIVWEEAPMFRVPIVAMWLAAAPFLVQRNLGPALAGWVYVELALLAGLMALAVVRGRLGAVPGEPALTALGDLGRHAPP